MSEDVKNEKVENEEAVESTDEQISGEVTSEEKMMGMLCHLLGIVTGFLFALIIYIVKKDESEFIADQAKEALNFQIAIFIAWFIAGVLTAVIIGFFLFPVIMIGNLIFCIMGAMKANEGIKYRYPVTLRLIK